MAQELSYILITPYTILKSRTGGVIARLLSRTDIELVGAQMIAPSQELAEAYAQDIERTVGQRSPRFAPVFRDYIRVQFSPSPDGRRHRVLMLVFRGEDACAKLFSVAGDIHTHSRADASRITGETIRDTYADLVQDPDGSVRYFEPAVLTPPTLANATKRLRMFAEFAVKEPNLVENVTYDHPEKIERTLVIIKPDNWREPSARPGSIIDMLSRTGLRIIGCKVAQISVAQAMEFYGPVRDVLRKKLAPVIGKRARGILEKELDLKLPGDADTVLGDSVGLAYADDQFARIIEFMSGRRPEDCPPEDLGRPGLVKCMILLYEGESAVRKIRDVLGPTDPTKAPTGTIRREFGKDVMVNTAHASDSVENAKREMAILQTDQNPVGRIILDYLATIGA
jgi:nucleoside diphosphate kinase